VARRALIIGVAGQDGSLLSAHLAGLGTRVVGTDVDGRVVDSAMVVRDKDTSLPRYMRLEEPASVQALVAALLPDELYYLAGYHRSSEAAAAADPLDEWQRAFAVNVHGVAAVLEAMRRTGCSGHLVYASSSHVFGEPTTSPQNEQTPWRPTTPYGVSKAAGLGVCASYRRQGVRASGAILFNHESVRRLRDFVTQRVAFQVAAAKRRGDAVARVTVGDPDAVVDWSWAGDVVVALQGIAGLKDADDFVIASGHGRTVRELATVAAAHVGLGVDVVAAPELVTRRVPPLVGDMQKLRARVALPPPRPFSSAPADEHACNSPTCEACQGNSSWVGELVDAALRTLQQEAAGG
jgi:GDPmannose 4,6-dehydratase